MNVQFTPETDAALEKLAITLGTTKAGILRYGIALVQIANREEREGKSLGIVQGERVVKELCGPWSVRA